MDELAALRIVLAVAEEASFVRAARRMRVSPAAASRAVAALESRLGTTLLRRTTRSVVATEAGAAYLARARNGIEELDAATQEARGQHAAPQGLLMVTAPLVYGRLHVLPVVAGLLARYPALDVRLLLTDRLVRLIEEGVDIAVRIAALPDSALRAATIGSVRRILVASPAYLARRGTPARAADLSGHDLIGFENDVPALEWRFADRQVIRFRPRLSVDSADASIAAARAGIGIVRVLDYQAREAITDGSLVEILADAALPPLPVSLVYDARRYGNANVRVFIDAALERRA